MNAVDGLQSVDGLGSCLLNTHFHSQPDAIVADGFGFDGVTLHTLPKTGKDGIFALFIRTLQDEDVICMITM